MLVRWSPLPPSQRPPYAQSTLKVALHSDLKIVDPVWTTALISTHHGYMIYDTLFALDEKLEVKPQMVDKWEVSPDKLTWTFTLRDGLEWHDGKPVTAEDCVASIKRWGAKDSMGQKLLGVVTELSAPDAKTIKMVLKQPYGLVLESLGKSSSNVPFMMPKAVAGGDANTQITESIGSGPFIFKKDEWKPGEKAVYVKNPKYKPRNEPASGLAGGKVAKVDRVEWITIPDQQTQVNALLGGEIDLVEIVPPDLLPLLAKDKNIKTTVVNKAGRQYSMRFNVLFKPFDNAKVRQAILYGCRRRNSSRPTSAIPSTTANAARCSPAARRSNRPRAGTTSSRATSPRPRRCWRRRATTARRWSSCTRPTPRATTTSPRWPRPSSRRSG